MSDSIKKYYFSIIKFLGIILIISYFILKNELSVKEVGLRFFILACISATIAAYELTKTRKLICLLMEVALTLVFFLISGSSSFPLMPILIMDIIVYFHLSPIYYFIPYIGVLIYNENVIIYIFICTFTAIIYFQHYIIISHYQENINQYENEESKLKDLLDNSKLLYHKELEQSRLSFENNMLDEKDRISQVLHDKLGHSINGSIYQLEASKVLMDKDLPKSKAIIQAVIDNLRGSMDEIRLILRKEKPDKKQLSLIQLMGLCEKCKNKYNIEAEVSIEGDKTRITDEIWEVILDNAYEAVSNSLKYAKCKKISIKIVILNKLIRCTINDDGIGSVNFTDGMGLQGIKQRAKKLNGIVNIDSRNGFEINTIFPIT